LGGDSSCYWLRYDSIGKLIGFGTFSLYFAPLRLGVIIGFKEYFTQRRKDAKGGV